MAVLIIRRYPVILEAIIAADIKHIERLEYAMSTSPLGPFKYAGVLMDESAPGCWTNHQSVIQFKNQWYLFYHNDDLSPSFDKNRAVRADSLFFNEDGTICKVTPTLRGVGVTASSAKIQVDRFSATSNDGVAVTFLDTLNKFKGWKTIFSKDNSWVKYNSVFFEKKAAGRVYINACSATGGTLLISTDDKPDKVIAMLIIPKGIDWQVITKEGLSMPAGVKNLVIRSKGGGSVQVDWISFK